MAVQEEPAIEVTSTHAPAYVSSGTFYNFLDKLVEDGIPHAVDKSLMPNLSGGTQSHLIATLKFLGLVENDGESTSRLKSLVDAKEAGVDQFKTELRELVEDAYRPVLGDLDIQKATPKLLRDKIRASGADGSTTEKAVRFYLKALKTCDVKYPSHLARPQGSSGGSNGRRKPPKPSQPKPPKPNQVNVEDEALRIPEGTVKYPLYFRNKPPGSLIVPADLSDADCRVIELQLQVLKAYAGHEEE